MTTPAPARPVLNGRYEIHRRIARGGMADVFLAHDQLLDRPVAVKVLFPQFAAEPLFVERFRREAQAAANLNHPSIVAVYDWGEHDDTYFIVMEYVEGRSLAEMLRTEGVLHPDRAAEIATDVSAALGFAHRNGTIHRDVKPGNILITPSGQVKVTDFGIARAFGGGDELTQTGSVMGTASYFSPEQAQGHTVDPRSDLYSLGVVLFEMVTGTPPFTGESPVAIAYKHVQDEPPMASSLNGDVPDSLDAIVHRLLAKNPAQRYASAEDVRADLRRFREGQPLKGASSAAGTAMVVHQSNLPAAAEPVGTKAVIDSTRAIPAATAMAGNESFPAEEYIEPPRRSGFFLVALLVMMAVVGVLAIWINNNLINPPDTEPQAVMVEVPNVLNLTVVEAGQELEGLGFEVDSIFGVPENESVAAGSVYEQNPVAGRQAPEGATVIIRVAQGAQNVQLPDLRGFDEEIATSRLKAIGLAVDFVGEASNEIPEGNVIAMQPQPNQEVPKDQLITLTVSTGPDQVEVPDVTGLTVLEASNELGRAGLANPTLFDEPSPTVEEGKVIRTDPPAGQVVPVDRRVVIFVSTGPAIELVPPVVGLDEPTAQQILIDRGFEPFTEFVDVPFGSPDVGRVVGQSPEANAQVETGTTVVISVGVELAETTTTAPPATDPPATDPPATDPPAEGDGG